MAPWELESRLASLSVKIRCLARLVGLTWRMYGATDAAHPFGVVLVKNLTEARPLDDLLSHSGRLQVLRVERR